MKHRILLFSDCDFFAGCEQMIPVLLRYAKDTGEFEYSFVYSYSRAYREGLASRINSLERITSVRLHHAKKVLEVLNFRHSKIVRYLLWMLFFTPVKWICIAINTTRLLPFFKSGRFTALHVNNGGYPGAETAYSAVIAARLVGIRTIVYVVNNQAQGYLDFFRFWDWPLDLFVRREVTRFVTASYSASVRLASVLRLSRTKVMNINNGILRRPADMERDTYLRSLGVNPNRFIIALIANLEKRKGIKYAIDAMQLLALDSRFDKCLLLIEGDGPLKATLPNVVQERKLKNVIFLSHQKNIMNLFNAADVVLLPSISNEDFPNVVLEGMSLGKPVIASAIAGIPEQIRHLETGILCKPRSSLSISKWISFLVLNPAIAQEISVKAKNRFDENFRADISAKAYFELYKSLVEVDL